MAKATTNDIEARGFKPGGFGAPADWSAYLTELLDAAGNWAAYKLGATAYAAATSPGYAFDMIVTAECCHASMHLWKRRIAFLDANANIENGQSDSARMRTYRDQADQAEQCAIAALDQAADALGVTRPSAADQGAFSIGHVETGRYPLNSTVALNA